MNRLNQIHRTTCQFCFFDHADPKRVIIHMLKKHRQDASFTVKCIVKDCFYSTKTWAAYAQYCKHKHNLKINNDNIINILGGDNIDEGQNYGGEEDYAIDNNDFNETMITAKIHSFFRSRTQSFINSYKEYCFFYRIFAV